MQALLDVAACSIITLSPPFVTGLDDGPCCFCCASGVNVFPSLSNLE